jgi:hypothetical protein
MRVFSRNVSDDNLGIELLRRGDQGASVLYDPNYVEMPRKESLHALGDNAVIVSKEHSRTAQVALLGTDQTSGAPRHSVACESLAICPFYCG